MNASKEGLSKDDVTDIAVKHVDRLREETEKKWDGLESFKRSASEHLNRIEKQVNRIDKHIMEKKTVKEFPNKNLAVGGVIGAVSAIAGGAVVDPVKLIVDVLSIFG